MGKALSKKELDKYKEDGFLFPIEALDQKETSRFRAALESYENSKLDENMKLQMKKELFEEWISEQIESKLNAIIK